MIETKQIRLQGNLSGDASEKKKYNECQKHIQELTAFGWETTTQVELQKHGPVTSRYQILARDTSNPNYNKYRIKELDYETAKENIKEYKPMDISTALLLLLLFIIPGVIYIKYKMDQKKKINENNKECKLKMEKAINEARNIRE